MYEWRFHTSTERSSRQKSANGGFTNTPMMLSIWEAWFGQDDKTWDGSDPREVRSEVHNSEDDEVGELVGAAMKQLSKSWKPIITQARVLRFISPDTKQVTDRSFFCGAQFVVLPTFGRGREDITPYSYSHDVIYFIRVSQCCATVVCEQTSSLRLSRLCQQVSQVAG